MIWIVGNKGMLGRELSELFTSEGKPYFGSDREVSILDPEALSAFAQEHNPDWIVNCSAYTAVDKAEEDREAAFALNRDGAANLARLAAQRDIPLIHISTDYVFDGTSVEPLSEEAPTGPTGVYGASKLAGEEAVRSASPKHIIIRTAWLYGQHGPNFVYTMLRLMNQRDSLKVVDDQHGSPTWARDLSRFILSVLRDGWEAWGTYHFSGEGRCTWHGFAREILRLGRETGLVTRPCTLTPCSSSEYPTPAKRPAWSLLSKEKAKKTFGFDVPGWEESLTQYIVHLSSLKTRIENWLEHSDYDRETAKAMHQSGRYLYVFITCQQAIEKAMKAVYEFRNLSVPRIHDLVRLSMGQNLLNIETHGNLLKDLSYYYIASRYSERVTTLSAELTVERSAHVISQTEEVLTCLRSMILL